MSWETALMIGLLMFEAGIIVNTVGADLIEKWKRPR